MGSTTPPLPVQSFSPPATSGHRPLVRSSRAPPLGAGTARLSAEVGRHLRPMGGAIPSHNRQRSQPSDPPSTRGHHDSALSSRFSSPGLTAAQSKTRRLAMPGPTPAQVCPWSWIVSCGDHTRNSCGAVVSGFGVHVLCVCLIRLLRSFQDYNRVWKRDGFRHPLHPPSWPRPRPW
ncbi:hypothetical protein NDU88_009222 [Pleurodeles waltl]|uniref:Uncharacterized protein n=1 Tax=Pleurodeles waltl TaxID=8319 RepID=A0AAV7RX09_PLEWA|nr:hypothetical protein NDU88_009222 [Pleurodeles waltl]